MKEIVDVIGSNPLLLTILIVAAAVILYSLLKKLFKLAAILVLAVIVFFGYIYLTHDEPEKEIKKYIEQGTEVLETAKEKAGEVGDNIKEKVDEYKKSN